MDAEQYVPLPGEGETRTQIRRRRDCEVCGEAATKRITFLLERYRSNPASKAYGRDDCSWCSDHDAYACDEHETKVRFAVPPGMSSDVSIFGCKRFPHMLLYWTEES
jgi:hypothetical protein